MPDKRAILMARLAAEQGDTPEETTETFKLENYHKNVDEKMSPAEMEIWLEDLMIAYYLKDFFTFTELQGMNYAQKWLAVDVFTELAEKDSK